MVTESFDAEMRPPSFDAAVCVINERAFEQCFRIVVVEMVDYAVTEVRCKYFPCFGIVYDETGAGRRGISSVEYVVPEPYKLFFYIIRESLDIAFSPFMSSGIFVSLVKIQQQIFESSLE